MRLCSRSLGLLAAFSKMLPQTGHDQPRFGRHARLLLFWLEPVHGAKTPHPFPDLLLGLASEGADPRRKIGRAQAVFVGRENEVAYRPKLVPVLASVHHHVIEAKNVR